MFGVNTKIQNGNPEIFIFLNKNIFFPGNSIKGKIRLKSGNFLEKGIILYNIYAKENLTEKINYNIKFNNIIQILNLYLEYPGLINFSLSLGIDIPFEINLPEGILPSFEYCTKLNNKNYGYIKYYLKIKIPELNLTKEKFIIIRKPKIELNSSLNLDIDKKMKILGINDKGMPILNASLDKNCYYFKEEITIKIKYNKNNSKINIKNIEIKLIRNITYKIREKASRQENKKEKIKDIIYSDELYSKNILIKDNFNDKKDEENKLFVEKIKLEEPENIFNKHKINYLDLFIKEKTDIIQFLPSFESKFFKCEYFIKIRGIYDTIFPNKNIIINIPISVYHNSNEDKNKGNNSEINKIDINKNINIENKIDNNKKEIKDDEKIYRNDKEEEWNNITNGQIIPNLKEDNKIENDN